MVTDTLSGLTWLNLNVTRGLSYDAVNRALVLVPETKSSGFRVATVSDVGGLFSDAGFFVSGHPPDFADPARLAANASFAEASAGRTCSSATLSCAATTTAQTISSTSIRRTRRPGSTPPWGCRLHARAREGATDAIGPSRSLAVPPQRFLHTRAHHSHSGCLPVPPSSGSSHGGLRASRSTCSSNARPMTASDIPVPASLTAVAKEEVSASSAHLDVRQGDRQEEH